MLSLFELFINGFAAFVLLPLALSSLVTGSKPPELSALSKYYKAEVYLTLVGNLLLAAVGFVAIAKLLRHFSFVGDGLGDTLDTWLSVPLMVLAMIFIALFTRAVVKVRRAAKAG